MCLLFQDPAAYVLSNLPEDIVQRLMQRMEDAPKVVDEHIKLYKENVLPRLEKVFIEHDRQRLIELNGSLPEGEVYKVLHMPLC